jgi:hypothetical protein
VNLRNVRIRDLAATMSRNQLGSRFVSCSASTCPTPTEFYGIVADRPVRTEHRLLPESADIRAREALNLFPLFADTTLALALEQLTGRKFSEDAGSCGSILYQDSQLVKNHAICRISSPTLLDAAMAL